MAKKKRPLTPPREEEWSKCYQCFAPVRADQAVACGACMRDNMCPDCAAQHDRGFCGL